ncbi:MAG: glycosyltransferase family 9 protein [Candidatus Brocadiia bacterium]
MTICEPETGGSLLCIRLSGLGDVIHTLNALSLLRRHRPLAHITWLVEDRFAGLLEQHPHIDELITIPRVEWGRSLKNPLKWKQMLPEIAELLADLRGRHFDASIDFQSSLKSAWIVAFAGANKKIGFSPPVSREMSHLFQSHTVYAPSEGCHRIERYLALLAPLGIPTRFAVPVIPIQRRFAEVIGEVCAEISRPLVVIHPGTSKFASFKRWSPEKYGAVARYLMDEHGAGVMVTFGPGEEALAHRVIGATRHRAVLAPRFSHLQQFAHLLREADLFLGSDTGPMHLASALEVPVVALFGPKDPEQTGPYCSRSEVVVADVGCRPCNKRRCSDRRCMREINVDMVCGAAERVLNGGGGKRAFEGPIRGPFTTRFELGKWEGAINTQYSSPEFYRWLSKHDEPEGKWENDEFEGPSSLTFTRARIEERDRDLSVRTCRFSGQWFSSILSRMAGGFIRNAGVVSARVIEANPHVPVRVCVMRNHQHEEVRDVVLHERMPGAITLRNWLKNRREGRSDVSEKEEMILIERLANLVRGFHESGLFQGDLNNQSVLLGGASALEEKIFWIVDSARTCWVGWLPAFLRDLLNAHDVKSLFDALPLFVNPESQGLFLRSYFDDFIESKPRQRFIKWYIALFGVGGE